MSMAQWLLLSSSAPSGATTSRIVFAAADRRLLILDDGDWVATDVVLQHEALQHPLVLAKRPGDNDDRPTLPSVRLRFHIGDMQPDAPAIHLDNPDDTVRFAAIFGEYCGVLGSLVLALPVVLVAVEPLHGMIQCTILTKGCANRGHMHGVIHTFVVAAQLAAHARGFSLGAILSDVNGAYTPWQ
jgi:hypothetical protein